MHLRSEHSTCDAPKAPDDAPECNEIALGVIKHAYAQRPFSRGKVGTWAAPKASDDAPKCQVHEIALVKECVFAQIMHPRTEHSTCDDPKVSDDAPSA